MSGILSLMTFVPLGGAIILFALPARACAHARKIASVTALMVASLVMVLCLNFDHASGTVQMQEKASWIPTLNVFYHTGVDGVSILLLVLTALLVPLAIAASPQSTESPALHYGLMLCLESGLLGAFTALNFFHWFIFYELSLVPAFFLVRLWGGPNRVAASNQFFLYTMAGSVALLLAFLALYLGTGQFGFLELASLEGGMTLTDSLRHAFDLSPATASTAASLIFAGVFLGFAVKVPLWPFHTWLPLTYSEAPTGTVMLLTGAMSKLGVYGFARILLPVFPEQLRVLSPMLLGLAVMSIVYSAEAAFAQTDLKRLLGYSSINHLGYCLLGVFAVALAHGPGTEPAAVSALSGVIIQMFNHGLTAATLFWFVGLLEERSGGVRSLADFGGLRQQAPILCGLMGVAIFSSLGLPGLNGFIGEFLIFKGVFGLAAWSAALSTLGLLITAVFLLTVLQKVFYGPQTWTTFPDLTRRERVMLALPIGLMFLLGVWPQLLVGLVNSTSLRLVRSLNF